MSPVPDQAGGPVLQMEGVAVGSMLDPSVVVAEDIHWTVNRGDFWVIAGLQGSGKSDFLMMTASVMAPLHGRYWLLGEEMPIFDEARLRHRLKLGLVFEDGHLLNHLTVSENVALPLRYHHDLSTADARPEVMRVLTTLELEPWADSTPGTLGRNWQKRAGLARALMLKPEILLIDNPIGGLDLRHVQWWLRLLRQLSEGHELLDGRPLTLVATTADLRLWRGIARHFAVLRDRRLAILGTWDQVEAASAELIQELMPMEAPGG